MVMLLGELIALGALGVLLAGAAAKLKSVGACQSK